MRKTEVIQRQLGSAGQVIEKRIKDRLELGGIDRDQAEALAKAIEEESDIERLARARAEMDDDERARFERSWIKHDLRADPANLRIMHVEGDSMMPTLHDGDIVLVDLGRRSPTPPGIFVLHDGTSGVNLT